MTAARRSSGGVAERPPIPRDRPPPWPAFPVIAVDAGRALVELDVGDDGQRHAAFFAMLAGGTRNCSSSARSPRAASRAGPGSHQPVRRRRISPAPGRRRDGGDADGLRQAFGGDAEPRARSALGWIRSSGRSSEVSEITSEMIGNPLSSASRVRWRTLETMFAVDAGHHQRDRAQAVLVEEPERMSARSPVPARSRVRAGAGDLAGGLRRVVDDQRGAAHLEGARRHRPPSTKMLLTSGRRRKRATISR